jgi:hypothetical protein
MDHGHSCCYYHEVPDGERPGVSVNLDLGRALADGGDTDKLEGIEDVLGSAFTDALVGDRGPNVLDGGASDDLLAGQGLPIWRFDWPGPEFPIDPGDVALGGIGTDACHWFTTVESCNEDGTGFCVADVDQLGVMVDRHVKSFEDATDPRPAMITERARRICEVLEEVDPEDDRFEEQPVRFENRPALPVECN